ncbi:biopolymer transporter ExbB [Pseudoroseicyclus aestuarii]|uniref:MotA/TolQ/ExbB proton channel family protein n=1 Tax=Pseudoroseicyclus aestuarii TaxID=1795041 RepID=A0A318T544_9RHOB|nr:biopolymer transporter ExbB [Pseudoroseicyclus aestuarii]PYE82401.1 hypothetical protein DFP88_104157 [Pseudoroseicyclus aestuarii]
MAATGSQPELHFSKPLRQIGSMLAVLALVLLGLVLVFPTFIAIYDSNPYLNAAIAGFFILGVLACFRQVIALMRSVRWIEEFARSPEEQTWEAPALLLPLATLLRGRGARMRLSANSARTILESVGQRVEEDREITRYLGNTLIFLGLLGTFYGLATTVPALVDTIRSLNPGEGESGTAIFSRLQQGLETQLGGMGTAFSSSLLGLAGSLVIGLLELFATHGQNRFYRELEEWLSSISRVGFAEEGGEAGLMAQVVDGLSEQMEGLHTLIARGEAGRGQLDARLEQLSGVMERLADSVQDSSNARALERVAEGQERLIAVLEQREAPEGLDAESRMRLRSMDVQLLRILEEISAGRQETVAELRADIAPLIEALRRGAQPASPTLGPRRRPLSARDSEV